MRFPTFATCVLTLVWTGVLTAQDQTNFKDEMLAPSGPLGLQWRPVTPSAQGQQSNSEGAGNGVKPPVDESFELSPVWPRLRALVQKSKKPGLADNMNDDNLMQLVKSRGKLLPTLEKTENKKSQTKGGKKPEATDPGEGL